MDTVGDPGAFLLTLGRGGLRGGSRSCRVRILRPVLDELPRAIRSALEKLGGAAGRWGDRPCLEGDLRAFEALSGEPGVPEVFRGALKSLLERQGRLRFELPLRDGRRLPLGDPPALIGVLNITPDSFSDGGRFLDPRGALEAALEMERDGADIIDVGGESSRPGASPVSLEEELRRVGPAIRLIRERSRIPISIDTVKAEVARAALEDGADLVNDVSALRDDPRMVEVARESGAPVLILHRRGTARDMQVDPRYHDVTREVVEFLAERIEALAAQGIDRERILVDPGIGFGKRVVDNLALIRDVDELRSLGRPVVVGASRKSFLGKILGGAPVESREAGTLAAHAAAIAGGAAAVRAHCVHGHRDLIRVLRAISRGEEPLRPGD